MNNISIYIGECWLGTLIRGENKYLFRANSEGIVLARRYHPIEMLLFVLNDNGEGKYDNIPGPFADYLGALDRRDLVEQAHIEDGDDDYLRLYKLAGLTLKPAPFTIKQA